MGGNHASRWKFGKQFGNSRHRFFHGPGLNNFDMALLKTTKITESKTLEFRFEAFNALNHPILGAPNTTFGTPLFGQITGTRLDNRELQFALRLIF